MLGSALGSPATATLHTSTSSATPTSPTRPSRLRGLSYLRSYTQHHLHPASRADGPSLAGSTSPPLGSPPTERPRPKENERSAETSLIHDGESGWLPTVQGRSGLIRDSLNPASTSTEAVAAEPSSSAGMTRNPAASAAMSLPSARSQSADFTALPNGGSRELPTIRFIPHLESRGSRPSLDFTTISRTLDTPGSVIRVGRYSERDNSHPDLNTLPVGFKSKVVSRRHCELWCTKGQWYIKDVKSSSGTFLNRVRLSSPGVESRPYPVNDGDVVQLGIDFKGGEEVIFRCVKIRIECNRGWQKSLNSYNTAAHKRLLKNALNKKSRDSDAQSVNTSECSICLNPVAPCQALFVAPCSHVWHYKCVKDLIQGPNYPNFLCPNCRFVADLDADVEPPEELEQDFELPAEEASDEQQDRVQVASNEDLSHLHIPSGEELDNEHYNDTPPNRSFQGGGEHLSEEELSALVATTSLQPSSRHSSANLSQAPTRLPESSSATTRPVTIVGLPPTHRSPSPDLLNARSATPPSTTSFALTAGVTGPMTPRNDAGPFVLDGGAGTDPDGDDTSLE